MNGGAGPSGAERTPAGAGAGAAPKRRARAEPAPPPGNTGTHWTAPSEYLLAAARRANIVTQRRHPLEANGESLAVQLQRFVHHEGNRPPVRQLLLHLRLLAFYPPIPDVLPDLVLLLEFENAHICRLAHYHVRAAAPIVDAGLYRDLVEALEREVARPSPARRATATKTLAKVFVPRDVDRAIDFVTDVFNRIGGARVRVPESVQQRRKVAGVAIPGTDVSEKDIADKKKASAAKQKGEEGGLAARMRKRPSMLGGGSALRPGVDVAPDVDDDLLTAGGTGGTSSARLGGDDDGAGGIMSPTSRASAGYIKTRFGKMLVGHAVFGALRRINRVAADSCRVEAFFFDSGLMSAVPSTVRHCVALLEIRSSRSPAQVSKYIAPRLPHKNPPAHKKLVLEDLGAKVYFARILGALAEDPNLASHIPDVPSNRSERTKKSSSSKAAATAARSQAVAGENVKERAGNLFKFLFNKDRITEITDTVRTTSEALVPGKPAIRRVQDPRGVEFAEALVNLLKNSSNRVLLEALRGLSHRRWTTWFEAPISSSALYNSPELLDAAAKEEDGGGGWGIDDDDDDDDPDDDDVNEAAYEDDIANGAEAEAAEAAAASTSVGKVVKSSDGEDPDLKEPETVEKTTFLSRASSRRKQNRDAQTANTTPFYLRRVGAGMVPALEIILRRVVHAMLHDEAIRRFSAADAVIVLARAKMYGHTASDHDRLRKAKTAAAQSQQGTFVSRAVPSSSRAVIISTGQDPGFNDGGAEHPFEPLVPTLRELMNEDSNQYVRGRAAVALAFAVAAGAGRMRSDEELGDKNFDDDDSIASSNAVLVRLYGSFVARDGAGQGTGLRLVSEVMDSIVHELLDLAPELAPSAIELVELWAMTHPTIGVCGRLGAVWEKVLSMGQGKVVGTSIFRAMAVKPHAERVATAAASFLRRRTLDLAVLTVGASQMTTNGVPEPLPRAISVEMERFFSLLWHSALLGPSAECRTLSIEAIGGAAALAGDPLRVCTYERLVELVRVRGLGLKIPAENVMDALDVLYFCRERFSEARHQNHVARDGTNRSTSWLKIVWRLAAEASSAAQILLGIAPPTGWMPLGPGAAADVANAEAKFGDVRDRQDVAKLKDASVARQAAPSEAPVLTIEDTSTASDYVSGGKLGSSSGGVFAAYAPKNFELARGPGENGVGTGRHRRSRYSDDEPLSDDNSYARYEREPRRRRSRSYSPPSEDEEGTRRRASGRRRHYSWSEDDDDNGDSGGRGRRGGGFGRTNTVEQRGLDSGIESDDERRARRDSSVGEKRFDLSSVKDSIHDAGRRVQDVAERKRQEADDHLLAQQLQKEEQGGRRLFGSGGGSAAVAAASYAPGTTARLLRSSFKGDGASKLAKSLGKGAKPS